MNKLYLFIIRLIKSILNQVLHIWLFSKFKIKSIWKFWIVKNVLIA